MFDSSVDQSNSLSVRLSSGRFTLIPINTQHSSSSPFPPPLISLCSQSERLHDCHPAHVRGADEGAVCFQVLSSLCVWSVYDDAWDVGCCTPNPEHTGTWCSRPQKTAAPVTHCFQSLEQEMHRPASNETRCEILSFVFLPVQVCCERLSLLRQWLTKQLSLFAAPQCINKEVLISKHGRFIILAQEGENA